ncbi:hypothetical protein NEIPOLOT_00974 [Neisseria polysaccharea ATCC 43768]|nr:hypothetical protein NEIPOLOT_00974 [Neisseria polysaccharea ATCC 43768]
MFEQKMPSEAFRRHFCVDGMNGADDRFGRLKSSSSPVFGTRFDRGSRLCVRHWLSKSLGARG